MVNPKKLIRVKNWKKLNNNTYRSIKNPDMLLEIQTQTYGRTKFYVISLRNERTDDTEILVEHYHGSSESIMDIKDAREYLKEAALKCKTEEN